MAWFRKGSGDSLDRLADAMWWRLRERIDERVKLAAIAKCPCGGVIMSNGSTGYRWPDDCVVTVLPRCNKCCREAKIAFVLTDRREKERK